MLKMKLLKDGTDVTMQSSKLPMAPISRASTTGSSKIFSPQSCKALTAPTPPVYTHATPPHYSIHLRLSQKKVSSNMELLCSKAEHIHSYGITIDNAKLAPVILANIALATKIGARILPDASDNLPLLCVQLCTQHHQHHLNVP
jgi:hypothetical protein